MARLQAARAGRDRAAGALDRTRHARAHPETVVRRVRDRVDLELRDVALDDLQAHQKKNCFHAVHQLSARETRVRASSNSTPERWRSFDGGLVHLYSTLISHGLPGSYGATAFTFESAFLAPASTSSRA